MYYGASAILFKLAKQLRLAPTEAEMKLWEVLSAEPFKKYSFRRQHPIATYIADFYSHSLKLVIEADGGIHQKQEHKQYDQFRDTDMVSFGITVLRFTNQQIIEDIEDVKQTIQVQISRIQPAVKGVAVLPLGS
jgi:very-short-patch-repair endonuclease